MLLYFPIRWGMPKSSTNCAQSPKPPRLYMTKGAARRRIPKSSSCPNWIIRSFPAYGIPCSSSSRTATSLVFVRICLRGTDLKPNPSRKMHSTNDTPQKRESMISRRSDSNSGVSISASISSMRFPSMVKARSASVSRRALRQEPMSFTPRWMGRTNISVWTGGCFVPTGSGPFTATFFFFFAMIHVSVFV